VTAHFGKDGSKLVKMEVKKFGEIVNALAAKQKAPSGFATMKLKDFSVWLAEFDQSDYPSNEVCPIPIYFRVELRKKEKKGNTTKGIKRGRQRKEKERKWK